jgi:hypothetical protein
MLLPHLATGPGGEGYRRRIELCRAGRAGTPVEVGNLGGGPCITVLY